MILLLTLYPIIYCFSEEITIYPTRDENYQLQMRSLFDDSFNQYYCNDCPPNVTLYNTITNIGMKISNQYEFKNLGSNNTHFAALTLNNTMNLYIFKEGQISLLKVIPITTNINCFSVTITIEGLIILDCYSNGLLSIYQYQNNEFILLYNQSIKIIPNKTKLESLLVHNIQVILYAQYFNTYQVLSLLKIKEDILINQTTWSPNLIDFTVSQETTFIYIIYQQKLIQQLYITTDFKFQKKSKEISFFPLSQIVSFNSLSLFSECDQILLLTQSNTILEGCGCNTMLFIQEQVLFNNYYISADSNVQLMSNLRFLIMSNQQNLTISLRNIPQQNIIYDNLNHTVITKNFTYYFDNQNDILFQFGQDIQVYQIKNPQIQGYFTETKNNQFSIIAMKYQDFKFIQILINYQIVENNNTQVYVTSNFQSNSHIISQNLYMIQKINALSGSLIQISGKNSNESLGYFEFLFLNPIPYFTGLIGLKNITIFYLEQQMNFGGYFVVGFDSNLIKFFFHVGPTFTTVYKNNSTFNISNYSQIQISYNFQKYFNVGVNNGTNGIQIYQILIYNIINSTYIPTPDDQFTQFLLTYNKIILLLINNSILIMNYDSTQKIYITQKEIQSLFKNFDDFNPIQIELNQQFQSSVIFINNVYNIIAIGLGFNNIVIPLSMININQTIKLIKIVNNKLIIYYYDQNIQQLQVWNIENYFKPYFEKTMQIPQNCQVTNLYSDNFFFYLQSEDQQLYIYNPNVPSHSTLYQAINISNSYFSSCFVKKSSFLVIGDLIYDLSPNVQAIYIPYQNITTSKQISQNIYYYSLQTGLNQSFVYSTNNQSLSIVNNFIVLPKDNVTVQIFNRTANISISQLQLNLNSSQILNYSLANITNNQCQCRCSLRNTLQNIDESQMNDSYNILTNVNGIFVLQNQQKLSVFNSSLEYNMTSDYNCKMSASYLNLLYTVCQFTQFYMYLQVFQINYQEILLVNTYQLNSIFSNIQQILVYENVTFILGADSSKKQNIYTYIPNGQINGKSNQLFITSCQECQNFDILNFYNSTNGYTTISKILIIYVCNDLLYYQIAEFNNQTQELDSYSQNQLNLPWLQNQNIVAISINLIKNFEFMLLITYRNSFNALFTILYNKFKNQIYMQDFVSFLPTYGNFNLSNFQLSKGLLQMIYTNQSQENNQTTLIIYNLTQLIQYKAKQPILIIGGIQLISNQSQNVIASINTFSNSNGQILVLNNLSYQFYELNTFQLNCFFNASSLLEDAECKQTIQVNNSFYENQIDLVFKYNKLEIDDSGWYYILLGLILLSLIVFCCKFQNKDRKMNEIELQFEL